MSWRELWSVQGRAKKFWKIKLAGQSVTEQFGRVGETGETKTKDFPTREAANAAHDKLIQKKQLQGWFDKPEPKDTKIHLAIAVETGDVGEVRRLLRKNPEVVHQRLWGSEQPLHLAARKGHVEIAKLLLDAGADVNARGEDGEVPVLCAFDEDGEADRDMLAVLLAHHPDLTIPSDAGITLHDFATVQKEFADFLRKHGVGQSVGPTPDLISVLEKRGVKQVEKQIQANPAVARSPRMEKLATVALSYPGGGRLVKLLLENGLNTNWTAKGVPLLREAIFRDSPEVVRSLLEHGADANGKGRGEIGEHSLLIEAWSFGNKNRKAVCDLLVQYGAKKNLTADLYLEGVEAVVAKVERDPKLLKSVADPVDFLNHAIEKGSHELVELLLRHGVNPNAHGRTKPAPLRRAVRHGRFDTVKLLLAHRADPNPEDNEPKKPLCYEVNYRVLNFKSGTKLQDLLLAHGMRPMPGV